MFAFGFHRVKVDRRHSSPIQMRRQRGRADLGDFHNKHHNWTEVLPQGAFGDRDGGTDVDGSAARAMTSSSSNPQYV